MVNLKFVLSAYHVKVTSLRFFSLTASDKDEKIRFAHCPVELTAYRGDRLIRVMGTSPPPTWDEGHL